MVKEPDIIAIMNETMESYERALKSIMRAYDSEDGDIAEIATRMFKIARRAVNGGKS